MIFQSKLAQNLITDRYEIDFDIKFHSKRGCRAL